MDTTGYVVLCRMSGVTVRNDKELTLLTPLVVTWRDERSEMWGTRLAQELRESEIEGKKE